jgi:hypothetical protein
MRRHLKKGFCCCGGIENAQAGKPKKGQCSFFNHERRKINQLRKKVKIKKNTKSSL